MAGFTDPDYQAWKAEQVRNNLQSRNQFRGITDYEPFDIARNQFDNPPFTWPAKQYTDSTGNQIKVQRGYMRSLITDPRWSASSNSKNRRLFFQFNPTVLVRSVQQTVGAMNPLLQDPAQLIQPVPGTSTFGFELLFNREKEVASGQSYALGEAPSFEDMMVLPNGDAALPSQVGVLADIMVLDTITGQGISKDMIDIVTEKARSQASASVTTREERIKALGEGDDNETEIALEQSSLDELRNSIDSLSEQYNLNIGNQAFLNPLPFRVLFSSLFMVEGVATSVEVQYQKFSATMIPTQCKVIINMYALYLGFASKDTFLTKNLETAAIDAATVEQGDTSKKTSLDTLVRSISVDKVLFKSNLASDSNNKRGVQLSKISVNVEDSLKDQVKTKTINSLHMNVYMRYELFPSSSSAVSESSLNKRSICTVNIGENNGPEPGSGDTNLNWEGVSSVITNTGGLQCVEMNDYIKENRATSHYLAYQIEIIFVADNVESTPILFPIVQGLDLSGDYDFNTARQTWTNSKSIRLNPSSGPR